VLVASGTITGACFHPELAGDLRLHERFLSQVR
jgi:glutamine amidotransferase PdxT